MAQIMNTTPHSWYSFSSPGCTGLVCAACGREFDLGSSAADHHPRVCPVCGVESVFLTWKGRVLQIVMANAPPAVVAAIRWGQQHFDELEFVEFLCALEELADAWSEANLVR